MRTALALAALLLVAACGSEDGTSATDPAPGRPTDVPAAPGQVTTRGIVTVMDAGSPELCLGAVAESYPPQCSGPPVDGWSWADHKGTYESAQGIRWGQFVVTGTWDGTTFTYESAVAAPVYDPMPEAPPTTHPTPVVQHSNHELEQIAEEVRSDLPGAQVAYVQDGLVLVDVVYDDGTLQDRADDEYGADVVQVTPMLIEVEE